MTRVCCLDKGRHTLITHHRHVVCTGIILAQVHFTNALRRLKLDCRPPCKPELMITWHLQRSIQRQRENEFQCEDLAFTNNNQNTAQAYCSSILHLSDYVSKSITACLTILLAVWTGCVYWYCDIALYEDTATILALILGHPCQISAYIYLQNLSIFLSAGFSEIVLSSFYSTFF